MSKSSSNNSTLRRIQADVRELALDPSDRYHAAPLETDMLEWHFTIRGADGTDFASGIYHGRIVLPPDYPFRPPHIYFLTPSGRFETHTKICLSFSAFHPELWQPAWGIRLILEALISFLPTPADGALGALDWSAAERKKLATQSATFYCPTCRCHVRDLIPKLTCTTASTSNNDDNDPKPASSKTTLRFQKEIAELQRMQGLEHPKVSTTSDSEAAAATATATATTTTTDSKQNQQSCSNNENDNVTNDLLLVQKNDACDGPILHTTNTTTDPAAAASTPPPPQTTTTTTASTTVEKPTTIVDKQEPPPIVTHLTLTDDNPSSAAPAAAADNNDAQTAPPTLQQWWWYSLVDPLLLHAMLALLAAAVYLWLRKIVVVVHEIQSMLQIAQEYQQDHS